MKIFRFDIINWPYLEHKLAKLPARPKFRRAGMSCSTAPGPGPFQSKGRLICNHSQLEPQTRQGSRPRAASGQILPVASQVYKFTEDVVMRNFALQ